jgi:hypothetical protein
MRPHKTCGKFYFANAAGRDTVIRSSLGEFDMRILAGIVASVMLAATGAGAQTAPTGPTGEVFKAEEAFDAYTAERGITEGFHAYSTPDAVPFVLKPYKSTNAWAKRLRRVKVARTLRPSCAGGPIALP